MTLSTDKTSAPDERGFQLQNVHWLWLSAAVIAIDQITKQLVVNNLDLFDRIPLFSWLNLTLMHNTGAAFSIFAGATPWFFVALSVVVAIGILIWMRRHPHGERLVAASLAMILGGALGNAIDRAARGYVVDFVDFHIHGWHYPAFNVADSAIVLGAILMGIDMLRPRRH
ncbi:lipoprotein signal peptidase [Salinisphaera sp. S4-8]|uniref:signal peptidase II n=1 Tax=Salinisphaera sp. S4-8 TaxID=633357 RepID=UPI0033410957